MHLHMLGEYIILQDNKIKLNFTRTYIIIKVAKKIIILSSKSGAQRRAPLVYIVEVESQLFQLYIYIYILCDNPRLAGNKIINFIIYKIRRYQECLMWTSIWLQDGICISLMWTSILLRQSRLEPYQSLGHQPHNTVSINV